MVERAKAGDPEAFDALVDLRLLPTYRLARVILGGKEEAEDATQEAFIAAWRALPSLRDAERFDAWFSRIVVNACRMSIRRRPRAAVVSIESIADAEPAAAEGSLNGVIDADALNRAIDSLEVPHRVILGLYYLEDRSVASIATILRIPSGTAKWRLHRARAALKRAMTAIDAPAPALTAVLQQPIGVDPRLEGGA
jgi:RNA polymerase sigma-70 factor (ECF subfamily)